jgi:predicted nucleic acid-binding protein
VQQGQIVLLDTNILIEAFRARCFKALAAYYRLETVEKCYEEALTGDRLRSGYVEVDPAVLKEKLVVNRVASLELAALALACPDADALDAGERHLFAHAHGRSDAWIVTCADRAAVRIAFALGWKERFCSLEVLARPTGAKPALKRHFTEDWLSQVRTDFMLARLG